MMIQGSPNLAHVVREFFLLEYAFEISWYGLNGATIRVAHRKGVWVLAKVDHGKVVDAFEIDDFAQHPALIFSPPSGLIRGFLASKLPPTLSREGICHALTELIHFWGGALGAIREINVIQPGRNAYLTETGDFDLSPQPESWKK